MLPRSSCLSACPQGLSRFARNHSNLSKSIKYFKQNLRGSASAHSSEYSRIFMDTNYRNYHIFFQTTNYTNYTNFLSRKDTVTTEIRGKERKTRKQKIIIRMASASSGQHEAWRLRRSCAPASSRESVNGYASRPLIISRASAPQRLRVEKTRGMLRRWGQIVDNSHYFSTPRRRAAKFFEVLEFIAIDLR